ncbi:glycerophosphodiester phosphodiesterase [Alicyclobacillus fodiniaquatilis]|uniref:Glycerophosphodiester phosphodiesterase n=1 Tax=Alicyclobacillus fodiniaquatilis TaxID=1661150 RepID=A0ABW4JL49_9BACL
MENFTLPIAKPIVGAHRGASQTAPENTLAAFRQAIALGATALELDVQLSADGHVVVIHDAMLNRTTNGHGLVRDHTLEELRALDAGSWFSPAFAHEQIPLFEEVLDLAKGTCLLHVELKHGPIVYPELEARVIEQVKAHGMQDQALLMSFDHVAIARAKGLAPEIRACVTYNARLYDTVAYVAEVGADGVNQPWYHLTAETVEACHAHNYLVHASLIDDVNQWELAQQLNVDLVDTNCISEILAHTREK